MIEWMRFAPLEETTTSAIASELSSTPLKRMAGMVRWFDSVREEDFASVNAPSPPECRTKWWGDHAAKSILRYDLRHQMHELIAEVERRRTTMTARLPGFI